MTSNGPGQSTHPTPRPHAVHILTRWMLAGSEENTLETCVGQVNAGYQVTIVYGCDADKRMLARVDSRIALVQEPSMVHPVRPLADLKAVFRLAALLRRIGATIVHTHQSKAGILGRAAARLAGVRLIIHGVHIVPFQNAGALQSRVYVALERALARFTDCFIHVSSGVRSMYLEQGIGVDKRHEVIYSGMPLSRFKAPSPPDNWRQLLGVGPQDSKPPVVVMLAALEPRKRQVEFIRDFELLADAVPGVRLIMAGGGEPGYRPVVESAIAQSRYASQIHFLGHRDDPERIIALADVCVLCSVREGLPRVVVQYITAGKPALVTHLDGIDDIVADGTNGLVVPADTLRPLMDRLTAVLLDKAELQRLAAGALATDTSQWTIESMQRRSNLIYQDLLA